MTHRRNQSGLSMLEVLASVTLFAAIAAGLAVSTLGSIRANAATRDITAAWALVHDKVEQFRALDPLTNPPEFTPGSHSDASNPLTPLGANGGKFNRSWTVTADTPQAGLSLVIVTVSWNVPQRRSLSGVTYICRTGTCS